VAGTDTACLCVERTATQITIFCLIVCAHVRVCSCVLVCVVRVSVHAFLLVCGIRAFVLVCGIRMHMHVRTRVHMREDMRAHKLKSACTCVK
jgi:hypothetical protein